MHELSLAGAILETAERHAAGRRVRAIELRVGHLRQVVVDVLEFYFEIVARGTLCEGARLVSIPVAARVRCGACAAETEITGPSFRCGTCGGRAVTVIAGEEFQIESIDVEEVSACITSR